MSEINKFKFDPVKRQNVCQCCFKAVVHEWDICPVCGWQNDITQSMHPNWEGCSNEMSLTEARAAYKAGEKIV